MTLSMISVVTNDFCNDFMSELNNDFSDSFPAVFIIDFIGGFGDDGSTDFSGNLFRKTRNLEWKIGHLSNWKLENRMSKTLERWKC